MIALLALAAAAAHPFFVSTELDKREVTLGEPFTLTVRVEHAALEVYTFPDPLPVEPLSLRGPPAVARAQKGDRVETVFSVPLVDLKTLDPRVPPLTLRAIGPDGPRELSLPAVPVKLRSLVAEEHAETPDRAHHGPKPPVPVLVRSWLWAWMAAIALLLAGAFFALREIRRRRARRPAPVPPPPTPEEEAMARLVALKQRRPWDRGLGRAAVFELSEIVRSYLGQRLRFDALDLTSDELLAELRRRRLLGLDLAEISEELAWQDMVKFAKAEPSAAECERAIDRAASLVDRTHAVVGLGAAAQEGRAA